jgi:hypothetical protein
MGLNAGGFVGLLIVDVIGLGLLPTIASSVATAKADGNVTGAMDTLLDIVPIIYVAVIVGVNVAVLYKAFGNTSG